MLSLARKQSFMPNLNYVLTPHHCSQRETEDMTFGSHLDYYSPLFHRSITVGLEVIPPRMITVGIRKRRMGIGQAQNDKCLLQIMGSREL